MSCNHIVVKGCEDKVGMFKPFILMPIVFGGGKDMPCNKAEVCQRSEVMNIKSNITDK